MRTEVPGAAAPTGTMLSFMSEQGFQFAGAAAAVRLYTADRTARVPAGATLAEAAAAMATAEVGVVVVGDGDGVEGVVSERDVVRAVAAGRDLATTPVAAVASTHLVWCGADATVHEVAERMMAEYVRHVLVEDAGALVGVVSARDLLGAYVTADHTEIDALADVLPEDG